MRATIKDVAKLSGVSTATVSNVLTGRKAVSAEVKEKVEQAMRQLNYTPNSIARRLKTNRNYTIGVIVPDIINPFFAEILKNIEYESTNHGYQIVMYDSGERPEHEKKLLEMLSGSGVDGIIDVTSRIKKSELSEGLEVPLLLADRPSFETADTVAFVYADNFNGGKIAAEHLVKRGYRKFLCIAGPIKETTVAASRLEGFRSRLQECGFGEETLQVVSCNYSFEDGYAVMDRFLDSYNDSEKYGVFASSDLMAWGVIMACTNRGVKIPDHIAIVGNDNIWCSKYIANGITTVENSARELGRNSAKMLLEALDNGGHFVRHEVIIESKLYQRTTT